MNTIKKIYWRNGKFCYDQFGNKPISKIIPIGNSKVFKSKHPYYISEFSEKKENREEEEIKKFLEERKREKIAKFCVYLFSFGITYHLLFFHLLTIRNFVGNKTIFSGKNFN